MFSCLKMKSSISFYINNSDKIWPRLSWQELMKSSVYLTRKENINCNTRICFLWVDYWTGNYKCWQKVMITIISLPFCCLLIWDEEGDRKSYSLSYYLKRQSIVLSCFEILTSTKHQNQNLTKHEFYSKAKPTYFQ